MDKFAARFPTATEAQFPITTEALLKHFQKYGLDNSHSGYRGAPETYKTYKTLRDDALVKVARSYLGEETYAQILQTIGYGHFEAQGRVDWKEMRDE